MPNILAKQAEDLAGSGQVEKAVALLHARAASGDGEAFYILANWALAGAFVRRDLPLARELFRRAADTGHEQARLAYLAFVANGTGDSPDWAGAFALLRAAAPGDREALRQLDLIRGMDLTPAGDPVALNAGKELSISPQARLFPELFTAEECDFLVHCATPLLEPSVIVDPATRRQVPNPIRTSDGAAFPLVRENPAIVALNRRLAAASGTRVDQGEPLQVLCYRPGQEYRAHSDALPGTDNQRALTFLVYLNDDYEGGETEFLETGLRVKGRKGDGLLFRNADAAGRADPMARHAGLPVARGTKLIASRWIRARAIDLSRPFQ